MRNIIRDVSVNIRNIRVKTGLSQQQLAKKSYCDRATISRIENGKASVSISFINELSHALNVDVEDLIKRVE